MERPLQGGQSKLCSQPPVGQHIAYHYSIYALNINIYIIVCIVSITESLKHVSVSPLGSVSIKLAVPELYS